jgi:nitrate reductase assembly molybdenum cofactor insertion protein NarJ
MSRQHYKTIASLFAYPGADYKQVTTTVRNVIAENYSQTLLNYDRFFDHIQSSTDYDIEELFGITFHIQAICFLDLGYVLFAEDFKRGEFLVQMKREQEKVNHDCKEELPDNLSHVLHLLSKSKDEEFVNELVVRMVVPALKIMLAEFSNKNLEAKLKKIKNKEKVIIREELMHGNVYKNTIQMLLDVLEADFGHIKYKNEETPMVISTEFLSGCSSCSTGVETIN